MKVTFTVEVTFESSKMGNGIGFGARARIHCVCLEGVYAHCEF